MGSFFVLCVFVKWGYVRGLGLLQASGAVMWGLLQAKEEVRWGPQASGDVR